MNEKPVQESNGLSENLSLTQESDDECETDDILSSCTYQVKDGQLEWTCQSEESKAHLSIILQNKPIIRVLVKSEEPDS